MPVFCWFGGGLARWPFPVPRCSAVCGLVVGGPGDGARVLGGAWDRDGWSGVRSVTGGWPRVSSATARPVRGPAVSPWGPYPVAAIRASASGPGRGRPSLVTGREPMRVASNSAWRRPGASRAAAASRPPIPPHRGVVGEASVVPGRAGHDPPGGEGDQAGVLGGQHGRPRGGAGTGPAGGHDLAAWRAGRHPQARRRADPGRPRAGGGHHGVRADPVCAHRHCVHPAGGPPQRGGPGDPAGASAATSPMPGAPVRRAASSAATGCRAGAWPATHSAPTRAYPLPACPSSASIAKQPGTRGRSLRAPPVARALHRRRPRADDARPGAGGRPALATRHDDHPSTPAGQVAGHTRRDHTPPTTTNLPLAPRGMSRDDGVADRPVCRG